MQYTLVEDNWLGHKMVILYMDHCSGSCLIRLIQTLIQILSIKWKEMDQFFNGFEASQSTCTVFKGKRIPDSSRSTTQVALQFIIIMGETCMWSIDFSNFSIHCFFGNCQITMAWMESHVVLQITETGVDWSPQLIRKVFWQIVSWMQLKIILEVFFATISSTYVLLLSVHS